jgi:hypothetical protein
MTPAERRSVTNRVRARLKRRPRTIEYLHIVEHTRLSLSWIKSFARGQFTAPNITMVCELDAALSLLEKEHAAR